MANHSVPVILTLALALAACQQTEPTGTTTTTGAGVEIVDPKAPHQGKTKEDMNLVREIRQHLVADRALSMRAKNAVVVVQDGAVTLRGGVADRVEHDLVIAKVTSVPGVARVDDRLTYATETGKKD